MNDLNVWTTDDWMELMKACSKTQEYLITSVLNLKYSIERNRRHTLLRSISGRLKTLESVQHKLARLNLEVTPASACVNLHDIVGIRIICSYINDIFQVIEELEQIAYFRITEIKDYISNPKPSGYRSLHVIGICTASGYPVQCEIQLRTTAMDSWASLEHQLRYKKNLPKSQYVNEQLLRCSSILYESDEIMQKIHDYLEDPEPEKMA